MEEIKKILKEFLGVEIKIENGEFEGINEGERVFSGAIEIESDNEFTISLHNKIHGGYATFRFYQIMGEWSAEVVDCDGYKPDGSLGSHESVYCGWCKLNNSVGKYGCILKP